MLIYLRVPIPIHASVVDVGTANDGNLVIRN